MAEEKKQEEQKQEPQKPAEKKPEVKRTKGFLKSRADHTVPVKVRGNITFVPPFGKIEVIKEDTEIDPQFASYFTFIKA